LERKPQSKPPRGDEAQKVAALRARRQLAGCRRWVAVPDARGTK
jgi:hypothetical protein